ncbi:MAG TPA: DUF1003 domain-containing protein [Acidimicrobiia bacterium]|nr:DUF1003 domain-containing protein [Acidimicrobiia bacterium]
MVDVKSHVHVKKHHPAIRHGDQLTRGEKAADLIRNGMGSWGFIFAALTFLAGWMLANRNTGFDPYPFILLNLVLSCLAAMQGAILLIAAKREDQVSSELARSDYKINKRTEKLVIQLHEHIVATTPQALEEIDREIELAMTPKAAQSKDE